LIEADRANAEVTMRERELLWAQRAAQMGSWSFDAASGRVSWSEGLFLLFALDPSEGAPGYDRHPQLFGEDWPRLDQAVQAALRDSVPYQLELSFRRFDGEQRVLVVIGEPQLDAAGRVIGLAGTVQDITERKRTEAALYLTQAVVDRMGDAAYWSDAEGHIRYVNAAASRALGYTREELLEMSIGDIAESVNSPEAWNTGWQTLCQTGSFQFEDIHRTKEGTPFPVEVRVDYVRYDQGEYSCALARDISERLRLQDALREQAIRDPLTGLFNRRYLDETLPRELERSQRSDEPLVVAMLDLDHFKDFNDSYGHEAGDATLRALGNLLATSLRAGDIACRFGGEEFTLVMPGARAADAAQRLDGLRRALTELHIVTHEWELPAISVSIGVAAAAPGETEANRVLARADEALYQAKRQGRNRVVIAA
jgi:diguanylate cyclase (GGDEF)-like protein/PAS domain S-box-containing protein